MIGITNPCSLRYLLPPQDSTNRSAYEYHRLQEHYSLPAVTMPPLQEKARRQTLYIEQRGSLQKKKKKIANNGACLHYFSS